MNKGDRVTGVPIAPDMKKKHPRVTGVYHEVLWSLGDETDKIPMVMVGDIAVDCDEVRPANRREKDTVLS